jgi:HSP20 family protein
MVIWTRRIEWKEKKMPNRQSTMTPVREENRLARRAPTSGGVAPLRTLQQVADEMDQMMNSFGFGPRWSSAPMWRTATAGLWAPDVDVYQKDDQLVIKADLPGLRKEEVSVEVADDSVIIQGERKTEHKDEREGYFRSERSHGSFCRVIPLPEGAITDQAKASFHDGVLEVTLPAPPQATRGRKLEITEAGKK